MVIDQRGKFKFEITEEFMYIGKSILNVKFVVTQ